MAKKKKQLRKYNLSLRSGGLGRRGLTSVLCLLTRSLFPVLFPPHKKNPPLGIKQAFTSSFLLDILIVQTLSEIRSVTVLVPRNGKFGGVRSDLMWCTGALN